MKHLKNLTFSFILMFALSMVTLGGDTNSPPCIPGQLETPPCSQYVADEGSTDPGETNGPPSNAAETVDLTTVVEGLQLALSLF